MSGTVELAIADEVATIILRNEAKRNSLDLPMLQQLDDMSRRIAKDGSVKAVVLRGSGNEAFSAGADFDAIAEPPLEQSAERMDRALIEAAASLKAIDVPVVAAIRGACFGGALQLALTADIRVASSDSKFGVPAVRIGLAYPIDGVADFVKVMGASTAALTFLTGLNFDAAEALRRGLLDLVVAIEEFDVQLGRIVSAVKQSERASLVAYKSMIRALANGDAAAAQKSHDDFAATNAFVPALKAVIAQRKAKKMS